MGPLLPPKELAVEREIRRARHRSPSHHACPHSRGEETGREEGERRVATVLWRGRRLIGVRGGGGGFYK
jgi:hypothetical protein